MVVRDYYLPFGREQRAPYVGQTLPVGGSAAYLGTLPGNFLTLLAPLVITY